MMQVRRGHTLGLLATVSLNIVPHFTELKLWVSVTVVGAILWRLAAEYEYIGLPGRLVRWAIYLSGFVAVIGSYDTVLGQEAGVALLVLASGMKMLETVDYRDFMFVLILCLMLIMAKLLENQSAEMTAFMVLDVFIIVMMMFRLHHGGDVKGIRFKTMIWPTIRMFMWSAPLLVLMFVFFPRITTRFLPSPIKGEAGFGLSDNINPGEIAELVQTDRLVFKGKFTDDNAPVMQGLYWRGGVTSISDGMFWHNNFNAQNPEPKAFRRKISKSFSQQIVLEPGNERWLYAFDVPQRAIFNEYRMQKNVESTYGDAFRLKKAIPRRVVYSAISDPLTVYEPIDERSLKPYLQVPMNGHERTKKLVEQLRGMTTAEDQIPDAMMDYFASKEYVYTLKPGRMNGRDVDEFLFELRRGFCSHYALAFATTMRFAGIPARVVWGFHGGRYNNFDGYYSVSTRDAHAWTEVWSYRQNRWIRYDPTTVIAPARLALGGQDFFSSGITEVSVNNRDDLRGGQGQRGLFMNFRLAIDAVTTTWALFLLQYDYEFQQDMFKQLGFGDINALQMIAIVLAGIPFCILWIIFRGRKGLKKIDKIQTIYRKYCKMMGAQGLYKEDAEGPIHFGDRCATDLPHASRQIQEFVFRYLQIRYNNRRTGVAALKADLRNLKRTLRDHDSGRKAA